MLWMHDRTTFIVKIVFYGMMILSPLALLIMNFVLLFKMNYNKLEIYRCLASLPKNVVSNIAEKLKVLKAENTSDQSASFEGETNKQEENIMKIIATSDSSWQGHISNYIVNTIGTVLISAFTVLALYFLSDLFITQSKLLYEAAPHIDYLMGAFGYQTGSMITLMMMAAEGSGTPIPSIRIQRLIESFETWRNTSNYLMNELRYGDLNENISPFKEFANSITNSVETANCSDPVSISSMHDIYQCFQPEVSYLIFDSFADALSTPYIQTNGSNSFSFANEIYSQLWHIENVHLYNNFFSPLLENIVSTVTDGIKSDLPPVFAVAACCTIASIGIELIIFRFNLEEEKRVKYAIRLLIHCPLQVLTQSQKIMNLLDGNFNEKLNDFVGKNNSYYDEIANNLPDSIICESSDHIVTYLNISACRLFNKDSKIGIPTSDFLNMKGDDIFIQSVKNYDINGVNSIEYVSEDNTNYHIELTISGFKNERILSFKDQTAMMRYNKLIEEERAKTDALLASIIPKNLVQRVQSGETNISFSVQSVSIVFIDIVEFTPWCGSNPASDVMNTLNNLFSRFDRIVNTKDTMTRIKCIGDCYMGAGGIFSEVNQPSVHAKEIVEFGLAAIDALHQLNKEINQNLRIRVGVNTGGPIVAGVLGVSKPTFEILGPAINMAQQMEHFGVPMNVHISRSVYELIYGDTFHIKERGEIELKKGKAVTYLVTGYK
ncbi:Adenylate and Guanylate cyclase catalytic domain containing protein [Tritrichomonas foetus]|uniref:Adenylate and Guanylate cyclase catalytic domain containing protein n=1 Tax=Tritrichomonas foetus TaxID=1144522 RepID=A0A1J4KMG3_9EUKA|nr:Adenylate and Guanylate cyclase catalytic domain containing protein [Tritrichomonas foetus]|eukprot:OHT10988.1 Adenylate and Guanylate cyclase catalytic domain containing protein [Tritrichomonas foetus]